jgi:hypothetical protein
LFGKINELPAIADFVYRYQDPAGSPWGPTQYLSFIPSQDELNPTEIGGLTGEIFAAATSTNFSQWELEIYFVDNLLNSWYVGGESGTTPFTTDFRRLVCYSPLYTVTTIHAPGASNIPCDNYDETYRMVLTLSEPGCGSISYQGYFTVPFGLRFLKTDDLPLFIVQSEHEVVISGFPSDQYRARIISTTGQQLAEVKVNGQLARMENQLARGLYLIQVVDFKNEVVWVEKLIK